MVVHKIADRLDPPPAAWGVAEQRPGGFREQVRLAIPAAEQEQQGIGRQIADRALAGTDGTTTSVSPVSRTIASVDKIRRPAGATIRLQILPKLS
jgi:hypothetical protein